MSNLSTTANKTRNRRKWIIITIVAAVLVVVLGLIASIVGVRLAYRTFTVSSGSMENTLTLNDQITVSRWAGAPQRGEIVVFTAPQSWGASPGQAIFPKRVIGLAGDRVMCCDAAGKITINGYVLTEAYLYPGDVPSQIRFDVTVPAGRIFVLGDHREISGDSRYHLSDNGGTVLVTSVIGQVTAIYWPQSHAKKLTIPDVFAHIPSR